MRAIITFLIVLSCGAAAMVVSSRAADCVNDKTSGATATAGTTATKGAATKIALELYAADGTYLKVEANRRQITFTGATRSPKLEAADWAQIQAALAGVPSRSWSAATSVPALTAWNDAKKQGGDFFLVEFAGAPSRIARADGWRASDFDAIKAALWQVIRRREQPAYETDPKKKTKKAPEFVAPFEALRLALRIKF